MTVPTIYYFRFWISNTVIGAAFTAFLTFFPSFAIYILLFPYSLCIQLTIFFGHQLYIFRAFLSPNRGRFEYFYLEKKIGRILNSVILRRYGWFKFLIIWIDEFGYIGWMRDEVYQELLTDENFMQDENSKFSLFLRIAKESAKGDDIQKEKKYLLEALSLWPENPVGRFRLAFSYEKSGETDKAIENYQAILDSKLAESSNFKNFINKQIRRVNEKGPSRRPPNPGLKFAVMY